MRLPLLALAIASFAIGTTEFAIMGLLPEVGRSLSVSIPRAGMLVTWYALSVTLGSPVLAVATARLPRRATLLGLTGIFVAGNLACAFAPTYGWLVAARVLTALAHGAFFGIGSVVATQVVPRAQRARAIAIMFAGLTLANVLGVPLGTLLGQEAGWRATFLAVSGIGVLAAAGLRAWVPDVPADRGARLLGEFATLRRPQVVLAMAISALSSVSLFAVFTYIAPTLETLAGVTPHGVTLVLLLLGVGLTIGNLAGGRLADWRLMPSVVGLFAATIAVLLAYRLACRSAGGATAVLAAWAAVQFALVSPLQMRVVEEATDAPNLASTLNQGAFNLGNAGGAWLGGLMVAAGAGYASLPLLSAAVSAAGLGLTVLSMRLERRGASPRHPSASPVTGS